METASAVACPPSKRGPKHGGDLRHVLDDTLYITHTGCQWRFLPAEFGPWTRVWSQFRRWSRNGTWGRASAALHEEARKAVGRAQRRPSMVVIDTHLARGGSRGGITFHDRGGPYGRTNGAKRAIAVDVTGLPLAARVVPASTAEQVAAGMLLDEMDAAGQSDRLELMMLDRGTSVKQHERCRPSTVSRCVVLVGINHSWMSTAAKCSVRSRTRGGSRLHMGRWAGRGVC